MTATTRLVGPLVALVLAAAAGCAVTSATGSTTTSAAASTTTTSTTSATSATSTAKASPATPAPGESQGAFLYRTQCASCHGRQGEGDLGPTLAGIASRMSEADELTRVRTGGGRMPPFSPALSDDELAAVVAYTRALG